MKQQMMEQQMLEQQKINKWLKSRQITTTANATADGSTTT